MLDDALAIGYSDFDRIDNSPHFETLRSDSRFQALVEKYKRQ